MHLVGKYNTAEVFTDNIDNETIKQIITLLNQPFSKDVSIKIMPDCHAGKGCVIGFTANFKDIAIPNLVGVDIGCGLAVAELGKVEIDLKELDDIIRKKIPFGTNVHLKPKRKFNRIEDLICKEHVDIGRSKLSIGTLGGGNHFIEVNKDDEDNIYLVIHSGSRHIGNQVAKYYQKKAIEHMQNIKTKQREYVSKKIEENSPKWEAYEIKKNIQQLKENTLKTPKELSYLSGETAYDYLHDMKICQEYAVKNRETMLNTILEELNLVPKNIWQTVHNYIDPETNMVRKGAISAKRNEKVIIPLNMRDGSLICIGKGNNNWNESAPHGAGRTLSRTQAKEIIKLSDFEESMRGIYTTSVKESTLDEAPFAYKNKEEIISNIGDTVNILKHIKPIYNFKA
ncbi:RtcB family protein [Peptostreptococcus faecalis]|uniref:RtcB family protein n=1 Tax=Peptostreptococcus faecalis TaxID=2045015 RepID=UPI000C7D71D8|nr:RtcB family protein [Peptostreptococcus faecalis]